MSGNTGNLARPGYRFAGWSDASLGDDETVALTLDGDAELTAEFEAD